MTPSQTVGPFFHLGLTADASLGCLARDGIRVRFRLLDGDGAPVPDGMIEIWQADASGKYDSEAFCGFGRMATDQDGCCVFETIYPGRVGPQAPHLNLSVFARGLLGRLCTRVYFEGDPALGEDAVLALVPEERRATLIARRDADAWNFEIHLQGERETAFFDI
jgi:protocatechuate 3,4-dioxygenase, alpha subunit